MVGAVRFELATPAVWKQLLLPVLTINQRGHG